VFGVLFAKSKKDAKHHFVFSKNVLLRRGGGVSIFYEYVFVFIGVNPFWVVLCRVYLLLMIDAFDKSKCSVYKVGFEVTRQLHLPDLSEIESMYLK